jgi:hypothetical protein
VALSEVRSVTIEVLLSKCDPMDAKQVQALMTRWGQLITRVSSDDEPEAIGLIQVSVWECVMYIICSLLFLILPSPPHFYSPTAPPMPVTRPSLFHSSSSFTTTTYSKMRVWLRGGEAKTLKRVVKGEESFVKRHRASFGIFSKQTKTMNPNDLCLDKKW